MFNVLLFSFFLLISNFASPELCPAATTTTDELERALMKKSQDILKMTADVTQKKSSPYLFKPLTSHIKLTYTPPPGKIIWQIIDPVASIATLDASGLTLIQDGKTQHLEEQNNLKLSALVGTLRAVFNLDFATLRETYILEFKGLVLKATPIAHKNPPPLVRVLKFTFSENLEPRSMLLQTGDEESNLEFSNVVLTLRTSEKKKA